VLSQPNSLEGLKTNYHYYVFPYYMFNIRQSNTTANRVVLDFLNFSLDFYNKEKLEKGLAMELVEVKIFF
jgi:hypothetical protein